MTRSRTISIVVRKKTGDVFDAILQAPLKMMADAKMDDKYIDEDSSWNVPMRVVSSGDFSEVLITLNKPDEITNEQFDQRVSEIGEMIISMKNIIESDS